MFPQDRNKTEKILEWKHITENTFLKFYELLEWYLDFIVDFFKLCCFCFSRVLCIIAFTLGTIYLKRRYITVKVQTLTLKAIIFILTLKFVLISICIFTVKLNIIFGILKLFWMKFFVVSFIKNHLDFESFELIFVWVFWIQFE